MPPIKHRQEKPAYLVEYGEIELPDGNDFGTGKFTAMLKPNALAVSNLISCQMVNVPKFQISLNINLMQKEVSVLLGRADGSDPMTREVFVMPEVLDLNPKHKVVVGFGNWQIESAELDGVALNVDN